MASNSDPPFLWTHLAMKPFDDFEVTLSFLDKRFTSFMLYVSPSLSSEARSLHQVPEYEVVGPLRRPIGYNARRLYVESYSNRREGIAWRSQYST